MEAPNRLFGHKKWAMRPLDRMNSRRTSANGVPVCDRSRPMAELTGRQSASWRAPCGGARRLRDVPDGRGSRYGRGPFLVGVRVPDRCRCEYLWRAADPGARQRAVRSPAGTERVAQGQAIGRGAPLVRDGRPPRQAALQGRAWMGPPRVSARRMTVLLRCPARRPAAPDAARPSGRSRWPGSGPRAGAGQDGRWRSRPTREHATVELPRCAPDKGD